MPYGEKCINTGFAVDDSNKNYYFYGGKELPKLFVNNWYDSIARYQTTSGVFSSPDPLAEKYYSISPYAYCAGNPVKFVDPDGNRVVVKGSGKESVINQLQQRVGHTMKLSLDSEGFINYESKSDKPLKSFAKRLSTVIDDNDIIVSVTTREHNITSNGFEMVGGAFMGNIVDNESAVAFQEVNPGFLSDIEAVTGTQGQLVMHEITEAYEGAKISISKGVSSPQAGKDGSVYKQAHNRATSQGTTIIKVDDKNGNVNYIVINERGEYVLLNSSHQ